MEGFVQPSNSNGVLAISVDDVIKKLGVDDLHSAGILGHGVKIGIIDTGVYAKHPWIKGKVVKEFSFFDDNIDYIGHGTHVAGIISMFAPKSEIYSVKVFHKSNSTSLDYIVRAIDILHDEGVDIINMSLGAYINCCRSSISIIINESDAIHISSVGNSNGEYRTCSCPAMIPEVIAVGSVDPLTFKLASFSSRGPGCFGSEKPLIVMPGGSERSCIVSAFSPYNEKFYGYEFMCMSGTSQASAMATGVVALALSVARKLGIDVNVSHTFKLLTGNSKFNISYGYGVPVIQSYEMFSKALMESVEKKVEVAGSIVVGTIFLLRLIKGLIG